MKSKHIISIDLALIFGTIFIVVLMIGYVRPLAIAPLDNLITSNASVLFEFSNADTILIDDNLDFSSPEKIYAENNLVINFKPGIYYWKISNSIAGTGETRELTILSEVNLKLKKINNTLFEVVNAGNTWLNVDIYKDGKLTGNVVLGIEENKILSGTKFAGVQNEN